MSLILVSGSVQAMDIQEVTSSKGITAWLVESHQNPIIAIEYAFTGGVSHEPKELGGLTNLLASTMDEGAGSYESEAFRDILTDESIGLSFRSGRDRLYGSFKTITDSSDLSFELLRLAVNEPRFDQKPVDRIRGQIQTGIVSKQNRPQTKSSEVFRELVYGDHPFGRTSDGSVESLDKITTDDLRAFHKAHLSKDGLVVAVVGDITAAELAKRLDQVFGDLPDMGQTTEISEIANQSSGIQKLVEFDQPQTSLLVVQDTIKRSDPDYFAAYVVNHILGGGSFSSRLFQEIREKRGLTYGVGTSLGGDLKSPLMFAQLQTANDTAKEALELMRDEWRLMAAEGPTQDEMDTAIKYIVGSYALLFTNTSAIAGNLLGLQIGERPKSYINDRVAIFESLTLEDLKAVAKRVLDDSKWTVIITGNPTGF